MKCEKCGKDYKNQVGRICMDCILASQRYQDDHPVNHIKGECEHKTLNKKLLDVDGVMKCWSCYVVDLRNRYWGVWE